MLTRRASQIIEAYDDDPARPNWSGVKYMLGGSGSLNPVPQAARAHNAKKIKDELEIENTRQRGANAERAAAARSDGGKGDSIGEQKGGTGAGRQKTRNLPAAPPA